MKKSRAEMDFDQALASDPVVQRLREMRRRNGGKEADLQTRAKRDQRDRERMELDAMEIGELQRWIALYSDEEYFASEHATYARAALEAKREEREVRLRVAQVAATSLIGVGTVALTVVLAFVA